jgi:hypothetical protein
MDCSHYGKVNNWLPHSVVLRLCYFTIISLTYIWKVVLVSRIMCRLGLYMCVTGTLCAKRQGIL